MNQKRWIAVAIAVGLFLFSVVTSLMVSNTEEASTKSTLSNFFSPTDELVETIVENGDMSQRIARLVVEGEISAGSSSGLFSSEGYNHENFMRQLKAIEEDDSIQGILLEVNSPGGGVYESAEIAKELKKIKEEKEIPIYVSMKNMAASGGYYISADADKIFATEETTTGSIGVIMSGTNYSGLMEKLGITDSTYKSGELKDIGSATRAATEKDNEVLQAYIDSAYGRFVKIVSEGRGISEEETRKIADGRIYDGQQAKEIGLIDEIGYPEDALAALKKENHLKGAQVIEYRTDDSSFASSLFGAKFNEKSEKSELASALESLSASKAPKAMYYYGGE